MSCNQHCKSCKSCPFSRRCEPGELGGSPVETYLGQITGPFFLPCHAVDGYKGNDTKLEDEVGQCAGAAIFRSNIGVSGMMPDQLLKLEAGSDPDVFNTLEEFVQHHCPEMSKDEAWMMAGNWPKFLTQQMHIAWKKDRAQPAE